jgi:hypothetical protein
MNGRPLTCRQVIARVCLLLVLAAALLCATALPALWTRCDADPDPCPATPR